MRRSSWIMALVLGCMCNAGVAQAAGEAAMVAAKTTTPATAPTTLDNLRAAVLDSTNAVLRYQAFAAKADAEGYKGVSVLFRAAAASEAIHLGKALQAITKAGGSVSRLALAAPVVNATRANLESALSVEIAAKTEAYARYAGQAAKEKNMAAVYTFKGALAAAQEHAKFIKQALAGLDAWKADGRIFAVCEVCGFTVMGQPPASCPICQAPADKFAVIR